MAIDRGALRGGRILVVEDDFLIASSIAELLEEAGAEVIGPVDQLMKAIDRGERTAIDGALLDIDLRGEVSFDVAAILMRRGIPFIFVTGYGDASIRDDLRHAPLLGKPFRRRDFFLELENAFIGKTRRAA